MQSLDFSLINIIGHCQPLLEQIHPHVPQIYLHLVIHRSHLLETLLSQLLILALRFLRTTTLRLSIKLQCLLLF